jgi:hypothetical protein
VDETADVMARNIPAAKALRAEAPSLGPCSPATLLPCRTCMPRCIGLTRALVRRTQVDTFMDLFRHKNRLGLAIKLVKVHRHQCCMPSEGAAALSILPLLLLRCSGSDRPRVVALQLVVSFLLVYTAMKYKG